MKRVCCAIFCGTLLFAYSMSSRAGREQGFTEKSKQDLVELENHWLEVENDPKALESILAPDFLHVVPVGIITKREQLDFMRKHPSPEKGSRHFEDMRVRVYGTVGIVNGVVVATDAGTTRTTLFTDVFVYRDSKWQAVNAQELPKAETTR